MEYMINQVNEEFVDEATDELKKRYKKAMQINKYFNQEIEIKFTPAEKHDPVRGKTRQFEFPAAYDIWNMYYYVTSENYDIDIGPSLEIIEKMFFNNPFLRGIKYNINNDGFYSSKTGFLYHLSVLKKRLLNGGTFSCRELGIMIGYSNQGTITKVKDTLGLNPKKENGQYILSNETAREIVMTSKSPLLESTYGGYKNKVI